MTKNFIITFSVLIIFSLIFSTSVLAKDFELPEAGITPDSLFYFLKSWKEQIQLFLTFNAEQKAKQYLHLAGVRLAEYQKMLEKGKTEIAQKTLDKYQNQLSRALSKAEELKTKGKDIEDLKTQIEQTTSKHLEVLQQNLEKVPEQAKKGIENAIENSQKQVERILEKPISKPCTEEAKVCPDSTSVGRTGPNCEFAPCPGEPQPDLQLDLSTVGETIISKIFSIKLTINPVKSLGSEFFTTPAEVKIILPSQIQLVEGELIQTINFTDLSPKSTEIKVKALAVGSFVIKAVVQKQNSGEFKKDLTINIISPDETSNWKTYRDEKYGFEVKYPLHWAPKPGYVNGPVSGYIQVSASNAKNIDDAILIPVGPGAPEVLGKNPVTKEMEIEGQTARLITNTAPKYVLFAVQYPQPVKINNDYYQYLNLLFIDSSEYAEQILSTFRFTP